MLKASESGLMTHELQDAVIIGFILDLVYIRARVSDLTNSIFDPHIDETAETDYCYFEVCTECKYVKNLQIVSAAGGTTIFIGHSFSIDRMPWAANFMRARVLAGFNSRVDECLCRCPLIDGSFSTSMITSADVTQLLWVRLAKMNVSESVYSRVSSHSCKATFLAMAARGTVPIELRYHLGYHRVPGTQSVKAYSRDELITPLRSLRATMEEALSGESDPDSTRSGMYRYEREIKVASSASCKPRNCLEPPASVPAAPPTVDENPTDISSSSMSDESAEPLHDTDVAVEYVVSSGHQLVLFPWWNRVHCRDISFLRTCCGNEIRQFHRLLVSPSYNFRSRGTYFEVLHESYWYSCCQCPACANVVSNFEAIVESDEGSGDSESKPSNAVSSGSNVQSASLASRTMDMEDDPYSSSSATSDAPSRTQS